MQKTIAFTDWVCANYERIEYTSGEVYYRKGESMSSLVNLYHIWTNNSL